jgi:molecular chaperone GrpE
MEKEETTDMNSAEDVAAVPVAGGERPVEGPVESFDAMQKALSAKTQEFERLQDRLLRLQAEFDNYRKRMAREKAEFLKFAHEGLVLELLPTLDNLERALGAARAEAGSPPLIEGIEMILRLFRSALEKVGVRPMESVGKPFDPTYHQAVAQVESSEEANVVVEEIQKGYLIEGRVLRPAMVKVSRAASVSEAGADGEDSRA